MVLNESVALAFNKQAPFAFLILSGWRDSNWASPGPESLGMKRSMKLGNRRKAELSRPPVKINRSYYRQNGLSVLSDLYMRAAPR